MRRFMLAIAGFALLLASLSVASTGAPQRTCAYYPNGKLVGCVRGGSGAWGAGPAGAFTQIRLEKNGAYGIYENETLLNYAYPRPRGQRSRYVAHTGEIFRRVSPTRWSVFRGHRLVAVIRGPDGVPAALGFVTDALS